MKRSLLRLCLAAGMLSFFTPLFAADVSLDAAVSEPGLTYNKTYVFDLANTQNLSMQVNYTSASFATATFTDGRQSTGNVVLNSNTAISSAAATATITLSSTSASALTGKTVTIQTPTNSYVFRAGVDFPISPISSNTACGLAAAFQSFGLFNSTCSLTGAAGVVYSTAPFGSSYNSYIITSSTPSAISTTTFAGGQDNASLVIGTATFTINGNWGLGASAAVTAQNLYTSINSVLAGVVLSTHSAAQTIVYATSTAVGASSQYALQSSSNAAVTLSGPVVLDAAGKVGTSRLYGGFNSSFTLNSANIAVVGHGFTTALPVLYATPTVTIQGLVGGTTYFVVVVDANNIKLSSTSAVAQTGNGIVLLSTSAQTTADTYTLAPLAISGTPSFKWEVSNDNANYTSLTANTYNIAVSSITMLTYTAGGAFSIWDLGPIDYKKIRLNVIAPTQGGVALSAYLNGKK